MHDFSQDSFTAQAGEVAPEATRRLDAGIRWQATWGRPWEKR